MTTTHVYAIEAHVGRDGIRTVTVICPHCGKKHTHGWPLGRPGGAQRVNGEEIIGHRLSHCAKKIIGDYFVHPPRDYQEARSA